MVVAFPKTATGSNDPMRTKHKNRRVSSCNVNKQNNMNTINTRYTTGLVSKQGGQWQVLEWMQEAGQWNEALEAFEPGWVQVGPYYDTEAEAEAAIAELTK